MLRRLRNIQTVGQYLNLDSTKALKNVLLLKESKFATLERAFKFGLYFTHNLNFKVLSVVIPRSLSSLLS